MRKEKGIALIIVIVIFALIFTAGAYFVRFAASDYRMSALERSGIKAFYAAEAGVEWAKSKLHSNPNWFTDLPHSPQDDKAWLLNDSNGFVLSTGDACFKVIRENNRDFIYSIGYIGDNIEKSGAISIIKLKFENPPFKSMSWEEI